MRLLAYKETGIRILKTALWAFIGVTATYTATGVTFDFTQAGLIMGITAALVAIQNLYISPTSIWGRSLSTFFQVAAATLVASHGALDYAAFTAAFAAGVGAVVNGLLQQK